MTYRELYNSTQGWTARHIAKDLMEMNGPSELVTDHDQKMVAEAAEKGQQ